MTYTFGLDTFGDRNSDTDGEPLSHAQTIRNVAEEGVFAEQAGVDFFGIGEHHTEYFPMPAGDVVLAAIAARTDRIHLGSAVTVLSSDDPVRVFQRYSTLNAVSGGRAEVILGRGSSIESFPLFGYDLADYEELFEEKATLFAELLKGGPVTWEGKTRAPLLNQDVVPHAESGPFPAWIGVGGNPQSVIRAARLGFSLALAIIGGPPARFAGYSQLFMRALEKFGRPPLPVLVHSPGHVAATDEQAKAEFWPRWRDIITLIAPERGFAIPDEESFDWETGPHGALYVGSPETIAQKIASTLRALGATRFDLKYGMPGLTHQQLMTTSSCTATRSSRASATCSADPENDRAIVPVEPDWDDPRKPSRPLYAAGPRQPNVVALGRRERSAPRPGSWAFIWFPSGQYSSCRRSQDIAGSCGQPSGESSHCSCRPYGVRSSRLKSRRSRSTPRAVVK